MTKIHRLIVLAGLLVIFPVSAWAIPTQYGDTGLLSQPTANTLNAGNICVGLWANVADDSTQSTTVMPFSITLGLGSFLEFYGAYPNLLFNDNETASGRGYVDLGAKIRVLGTRSSLIKVAIDGQLQRQVSNDPVFNGLVDYQGRVIASIANNRIGLHAFGSYRVNDEPTGISYEDQVGFGGGIDFFPTDRLRLIVEGATYAEKIAGTDRTGEVTGGFQYYISPHLTVSLGVGFGLSDLDPDFRVLAGISTCQGIGSYSPYKRADETEEVEQVKEPDKEPVKVLKLKLLTPLIAVPQGSETSPATGVDSTRVETPEKVDVPTHSVATPVMKITEPSPAVVSASEPAAKPAAVAAQSSPSAETAAVEAESEGTSAAEIGKNILLAPVAIIAAPFVGAKMLADELADSGETAAATAEAGAQVAVAPATASTPAAVSTPTAAGGAAAASAPAAMSAAAPASASTPAAVSAPTAAGGAAAASAPATLSAAAPTTASTPAAVSAPTVAGGAAAASAPATLSAAAPASASAPTAVSAPTAAGGAAAASAPATLSAAAPATASAPAAVSAPTAAGGAAAASAPATLSAAAPATASAPAAVSAPVAAGGAAAASAPAAMTAAAPTTASAPAAVSAPAAAGGAVAMSAPAGSQSTSTPASVSAPAMVSAPTVAGAPAAAAAPAGVSTPAAAPSAVSVPVSVAIPKATDLEVIVPPDAPVVVVEPTESIMAPGTIPDPSVNFPDSPSRVLVASAATPVLTTATKTQLYRKFVLPEFTFQFGKYSLTEAGKAVLADIAKELKSDGKWFIVRLDGHTDSTGPEPYNDKLSLQRAIEYAVYLIDKQTVDPRRIFVKGFGEHAPIASNATPEGRKMNRRVELLLLVKAGSGQ